MTIDEFQDRQFQLSVNAGMNQRYHQKRAHVWIWWNRSVQISVAVLAAIGAVLASIAPAVEHIAVDVVSIIVAVLAALAAIALNVLPIGDWAQEHLDYFRRWTDLREDVDGLLFDLRDSPSDALIERLRNLDGKAHRICGSEPASHEDFLRECFDAECRSRQHAGQSHCEPAGA